jgi:hypothetical protein
MPTVHEPLHSYMTVLYILRVSCLVRRHSPKWQVLGSNQRRRCRRFYRPPPKPPSTRANSAASESVGWNRDQTPAVNQRQPMSPGHPPSTAYSAPAARSSATDPAPSASAPSPADASSASSKPKSLPDCLEIGPRARSRRDCARSMARKTVPTREKNPAAACPPKRERTGGRRQDSRQSPDR